MFNTKEKIVTDSESDRRGEFKLKREEVTRRRVV